MELTAPAKLNLCLFVGPPRDDGLHEIRSLFEPISLADEITVTESSADSVVCPEVGGENLAASALAMLRERGWEHPPVRIEIAKRIPVAGGLGGGSADAAAVLRLASELDGVEEDAMKLGADVRSQLQPGFSLVGGAGEQIQPLPDPDEHAFVLWPQQQGLSTAEVYSEADRLGLGRDLDELEQLEVRVREATQEGASPMDYQHLLVNDLEPAALSLRPEIAAVLEAMNDAGAARALISGSGPTVFGLFANLRSAEVAASNMGEQAIVCTPGVR